MIVQSRMGATRLPGKSMMDLAGAPLISRLLERVQRCKRLDEIVLATTQKPEDDVIEEVGRAHGLSVFRGSENDLVDRYYQAAKMYEANPIAFIAEQAGGIATDGERRVLEVEPTEIHQRTPLVVGSVTEMNEFAAFG